MTKCSVCKASPATPCTGCHSANYCGNFHPSIIAHHCLSFPIIAQHFLSLPITAIRQTTVVTFRHPSLPSIAQHFLSLPSIAILQTTVAPFPIHHFPFPILPSMRASCRQGVSEKGLEGSQGKMQGLQGATLDILHSENMVKQVYKKRHPYFFCQIQQGDPGT